MFKSHEKEIITDRDLWSLKKYSRLHNVPLPYAALEGEAFLSRRDGMAKRFLQPKMVAEYVPMYSDVMDDFLLMFDKILKTQNNEVFDMREYLFPWQLECFGMHSFRHRFGLLTENDKSKIDPDVMTIKNNGRMLMEPFSKLESSKGFKHLKTKDWKLFEERTNKIYQATRSLLSKYPEHLSDPSLDTTNEDVVAMMVDNFRGGIDTILNSIQWALIELARNANVQERIYQEQHTILREKTQISYSNLKRQLYLRGCLKEIFRLRPLVPLNGKEDSERPGSIRV